MILNEAVTLLGYKVDERELERYKKQLRQQEAEALKLLNQREARHKAAEREKLAAAQRAANEQARIAARAANAQIREAQRSQRAQERALAAQTRAHERAQAKMARDTARRLEQEKKAALAHLRGSGAGMGGLGMLGGAVGVGGLMAGAKSVYDTGVSRESMMTGLKNLPGMNESAALAQFKALEKFNLQTPYTLDEIIQGYIRLKNVGLDASQRAMEAYGGIAASIPGKKINDFVEAVADGVMGQGRRLKEFGIDLSMEGDKAAITFRGQTLRVARDSRSIEKALQDISFKNFGKTMADMAKTTGGQMSNLTDQIDNLKWQIWQGGMKQAVGELIKGSSKLLKQWMPIAREFAIIQRLNMPRYLKMVGDALPLINLGLGIMLARMTGLKMLAMAEWATKTAMAFKTLGAAQFFLNGGLGIMPTLIGGATLALGALIADFGYFMTTGDSAILKFTERWPELNKWIKEAYESNRIFIYAVQIGFERIQNWIRTYILPAYQDWWNGMKSIWEWMGPKFEWLFKMLDKTSILMNGLRSVGDAVVNWSINNEAGSGGAAGGGGYNPAQGNILQTAKNFAIGAVGQSAADKWAKSSAEMDGFKVNKLYVDGVACAISAEKVVQDAGATKAVLDAMNPHAGKSMKNLLNRGLAELVPFDQLKGGELFYTSDAVHGASHTGIVGEGGKTLIHASNTAGRNTRGQLGLGQRFTSTPNYLGSGGKYLRIKPQYMNAPAPRSNQVSSLPPIMIEQTFTGQVSPAQVKGASNTGVQVALHRASLSAAQGMS